jgi:hypothetical protein
MNEKNAANTTTWQGPERRSGRAPAPMFGELLVECGWRPTDRPAGVSEGWLRANGYAPDRRAR